jgi:putative acetyltransferase
MNPEHHHLRLATNSDAEFVWRHISTILRSYGIAADRGTTDLDLSDIDRNYNKAGGAFFTLWDEDKLIGTAAFRFIESGHAEIGRMYLLPEYRGQGLGKFLLTEMMDRAKSAGARRLSLKTASVLKEAICLYEAFGFQKVAFESSGNCDVLMSMPLQLED